jgi:hypothetical protein
MSKQKQTMEKIRAQQEQKEKDEKLRRYRINKNEETKAKIRLYKEYKAQQLMELEMIENMASKRGSRTRRLNNTVRNY